MVAFDEEHKSIKGNIKEKKARRVIRKIIASSLILVNLLTFSGCAAKQQESTCDIEGEHAHFYVSSVNGLGRYIISEKEYTNDLHKTDKVIEVTDENRELLEAENKYNLFRIDDNEDTLRSIESFREDYTEYGSKEMGWKVIPTLKPRLIFLPSVKEEWSTEEDISGYDQTRETHHYYRAFNLEKNNNGKYEPVESEYKDSIFDLSEDYDYVPFYFSVTEKIQNGTVVDATYDYGKKDNGTYVDGKLVNEFFEEEITYNEAAKEDTNQL